MVDCKTGINKIYSFLTVRTQILRNIQEPIMKHVKNMLLSLIKNLIVAPVRPLHPKENFF